MRIGGMGETEAGICIRREIGPPIDRYRLRATLVLPGQRATTDRFGRLPIEEAA
jgi:hypothetical protein